MSESAEAGSKPRGGTARRQNTKPSGGARRDSGKPLRIQLHLGESVVKRLRVHTALSGRNDSAVVSEILLSYLTRFGQGKELFDHPDTLEDRQDTPPE